MILEKIKPEKGKVEEEKSRLKEKGKKKNSFKKNFFFLFFFLTNFFFNIFFRFFFKDRKRKFIQTNIDIFVKISLTGIGLVTQMAI